MGLLDVPISIESLKELLPHRFPFLLIDRVVAVDGGSEENREGRTATAIKNVTVNEPHFTGHFPHRSVMPGVLIVEAMAQTCALTAYTPGRLGGNYDFFIASVKDAKFRRPVVPGDTMRINAKMIRDRGSILQFEAEAFVENELVANCEILAKMFPKT